MLPAASVMVLEEPVPLVAPEVAPDWEEGEPGWLDGASDDGDEASERLCWAKAGTDKARRTARADVKVRMGRFLSGGDNGVIPRGRWGEVFP